MREFELTFLLKPDLDDAKVEEVTGRVRDIISKDGTPGETEAWGKKPLAYPIKRLQEAWYVHIPFTSGPDVPAELTRYFGFSEDVIRHLIVNAIPEPPVIEPRIVTRKTEVFIPAAKVKEAAESAPAEGTAPAENPAPAAESAVLSEATAVAEATAGERTSEAAEATAEVVPAAPADASTTEAEATPAKPKATRTRTPKAKATPAADEAPKGVEEVSGEVEKEETSSPEDTPEG